MEAFNNHHRLEEKGEEVEPAAGWGRGSAADSVEVLSKSDEADVATRWASDGSGDFEVADAGHFVQEAGEVVAAAALKAFAG